MKNNKNKSEHKEKISLDDQSLSKASGGRMNAVAYGNPHLQQPVPRFPKKDKNSNSNLGNDFNSPYFNPNSNN